MYQPNNHVCTFVYAACDQLAVHGRIQMSNERRGVLSIHLGYVMLVQCYSL